MALCPNFTQTRVTCKKKKMISFELIMRFIRVLLVINQTMISSVLHVSTEK